MNAALLYNLQMPSHYSLLHTFISNVKILMQVHCNMQQKIKIMYIYIYIYSPWFRFQYSQVSHLQLVCTVQGHCSAVQSRISSLLGSDSASLVSSLEAFGTMHPATKHHIPENQKNKSVYVSTW